MRIRIDNATVINEECRFKGTVTLDGGDIVSVVRSDDCLRSLPSADVVVAADDLVLIPGVIDGHVHFRTPGLTHKGDIFTESRAAAAGGVTSFMDMPNVVPPTVSFEALEEKFAIARRDSLINYSFLFGCTRSNTDLLPRLDVSRVPAVKVFMGSSTGNMLVDDEDCLEEIFRCSPVPIVSHCEDPGEISVASARCVNRYGADPDVCHHPFVRSDTACWKSVRKAMDLARSTGARLHVAHVSSRKELDLFPSADGRITAEVCLPHILFRWEDYGRLGTRIKCNPAVKFSEDRCALRSGLSDGCVFTVATDHAPHLLSEKVGGVFGAASGIPMVQFSLPAMMGLADEGVLSHERVVRLMCHNPALLFGVRGRGFIREGFRGDVVLLRRCGWTLGAGDVVSRCGWSPLEGEKLGWKVVQTFCNGVALLGEGRGAGVGEPLIFDR